MDHFVACLIKSPSQSVPGNALQQNEDLETCRTVVGSKIIPESTWRHNISKCIRAATHIAKIRVTYISWSWRLFSRSRITSSFLWMIVSFSLTSCCNWFTLLCCRFRSWVNAEFRPLILFFSPSSACRSWNINSISQIT